MRRVSHVVAGVLGGALLAGCGGAPSASPPPSPGATNDAPSPTAAPTPPTLPAEVRSKTERGAIAATNAFLTALKFAGSTGDVEPLEATFTKECTRCQAIANGISDVYKQGGYIRGGDWNPRKFELQGIVDNIAYVDAIVDSAPQSTVERAGGEVSRFEGEKRVLHAFQLRWTSQQGWKIGALDPTS